MDNNDNNYIFLPEWFPAKFSDSEKKLTWVWESGHNPVPTSPLSTGIRNLTTSEGANDANQYLNREQRSVSKVINGYTYYANNLTSTENPDEDNKHNLKVNKLVNRLDQDWKTKYLPEITNDLTEMKKNIEIISDLKSGFNSLDNIMKLHKRHWYIHFLVVLPLHDATDKFYKFLKKFIKDFKLSDLYNLFNGIDNKSIEIDKYLYELVHKYRDVLDLSNSDDFSYLINNTEFKFENSNKFISEFSKFINFYGYRSVGFDLKDSIWIEDPQIVLDILKRYPMSINKSKSIDYSTELRQQTLDNILSNLPNDKTVEEFNELYDPLKEIWYLKEDHSFYIDQASSSVLSLAIKKIGKLMHENALIDELEDIFFLKMSELNLFREKAIDIDFKKQILFRKNERDKYKNITPPKYLGAIDAIQSESMSLNSLEKIKIFKGVPASLGKSIGPAKIIKSFEDSAKLKEGDIMVCISTNPSWTPLFGIVSGIISETGGTLSHTAVVAREYNIPTILEVENSTELISDNDLIEVDADKGIITIIS